MSPVIDLIHADTLEYTRSAALRGGFEWKGLEITLERQPNPSEVFNLAVRPHMRARTVLVEISLV